MMTFTTSEDISLLAKIAGGQDSASVTEVVERWNKSIDDFINGPLAEALGAQDGRVRGLDKWFEGNALIEKQNFYQQAKAILDFCRTYGWDVKINMQSNKLAFEGGRI